jgi:hypothetical protein
MGLLFFSGVGYGGPDDTKAFLTVREVLDRWEANYGSIQSMKVGYSVRMIRSGGPETGRVLEDYHVERTENGKLYHVLFSKVEDRLPGKSYAVESAFDGHVSKEYKAALGTGSIDPGLRDTTYAVINDVRRYLMIERIRSQAWKQDFPDGIPAFSWLIRSGLEGQWSKVLPDLQYVAGEPCHVIERHRPGERNIDRIWIAQAKGMLPMRRELVQDGEIINMTEVRGIARVMTDVGEFWYPSEVHSENGRTRTTWDVKVQEFIPHVTVPLSTFDVHFPDGTRIIDNVPKIH